MNQMVQCRNGHFYHAQSGQCPHCSNEGNQIKGTIGINPFSEGNELGTKQQNHPFNEKSFPLPNQFGKVEVKPQPGAVQKQPGQQLGKQEEPKTMGMIFKQEGIDPVVGWLVCIEGNNRGRDYRIHSDKNSIGRSESNDIQIDGDLLISRENHATIVYDSKKRQFRLLAGGGRGLVYLNDDAVDLVQVLKANDTIEIGETKLLFVPFCGESFNWET